MTHRVKPNHVRSHQNLRNSSQQKRNDKARNGNKNLFESKTVNLADFLELTIQLSLNNYPDAKTKIKKENPCIMLSFNFHFQPPSTPNDLQSTSRYANKIKVYRHNKHLQKANLMLDPPRGPIFPCLPLRYGFGLIKHASLVDSFSLS